MRKSTKLFIGMFACSIIAAIISNVCSRGAQQYITLVRKEEGDPLKCKCAI